MGALVTRALRPIKSFNIENRAHRVISKEKPTPAPTYPQNLEDIKRTLESDPNISEKLDQKNQDLDNRLKDVYVTSLGQAEDDITREKKTQSTRALPQNRSLVPDFEFGFKEPEKVSYGKTTLRHVNDFIAAHQTNPDEVTAGKIAFEYKLKEEDVENIIKYFKTYEIYVPKTKKTAAIFAGPANMRKLMQAEQVKQLESKDTDSNAFTKGRSVKGAT